jgi:hypothetical protein
MIILIVGIGINWLLIKIMFYKKKNFFLKIVDVQSLL